MFFPPSPPPPTSALLKNIGGIIIALIGVVVYSQLKIAESSPTTQPDWCDAMLPASCLNWAERSFGTGEEQQEAVRPAGQYALVKMEEGDNSAATNGSTVGAATLK